MKARGFTLIELIVVLVILGILAASAAPFFVDLKKDASKGVLDGVKASMQSAATMVYAKALIQGKASGSQTLTITGITGTVAISDGYPTTGDMTKLLTLTPASDFTVTAASALVQFKGQTNCHAQYTNSGSGSLTYAVVDSGC